MKRGSKKNKREKNTYVKNLYNIFEFVLLYHFLFSRMSFPFKRIRINRKMNRRGRESGQNRIEEREKREE